MRLRWFFLAVALAVGGSVNAGDTEATAASTPSDTNEATTTEAAAPQTPEPASTTSTAGGDTDAPGPAGPTDGTGAPTDGPVDPKTDGPDAPTDAPVDPKTDAPVPSDQTDGPTDKPVVTTTTKKEDKTTTTKGPTTTTEPPPDVENFKVTCDEKANKCTYSMQVPGLDIDTFNSLMQQVNQTEMDVNKYEREDLVELEEGVTSVYSDAQATVDYVNDQLEAIKEELDALATQSNALDAAITSLNKAVYNANQSLNKILSKKSSCLYRNCVLKETTTPKPTTTTTVRTTPTPFCSVTANKGVCQHDGTCKDWYNSYYCECKGNLDGQENNCATSVCEVVKDAQLPGLIYSPGYNGTAESGEDTTCEDGAQWTITGADPKKILKLKQTSDTDLKVALANLVKTANLQLTVTKYKLKITSTTKMAQINSILAYGNSATLSYTSVDPGYFWLELEEVDKL
ncbi:hypothetical protein PFISCL1PPCAC_11297 [Pristionchus fissidentatus]|uniref:EGF-like domain-containing protein n=1 Tax=Pristionchus fissidentatus TaxID=1538716 RepID=A0AAV5VK24_9BILA|nr:hypothetical protein PFISCL1PPCAC_11297 [Pristionchus fissidentatus]